MRVVGIDRLKHYWQAYLLIALPLLLVLVFSYYPIFNGFVHIFYRWNGDNIEEFVGLQNIIDMFHDNELWHSFMVVIIFMIANLIKMIPAIVTAVVLHHILSKRAQYLYRVFFVIPMIVPYVVLILIWKYYYNPQFGVINEFLRAVGLLGPTEPIAWLTDKDLTIPSLIFQRFPWVGAFGVLIYLAGLQNIGNEIYEAADLDGAGPLRVFFNIELPLITTQIRITLILMMINTLRAWDFVYLFVGSSGGKDGVAMVPGLYIFNRAFERGEFGYGCAIGFLLFLITLILTWINNKYVRVDK